MMRRRGFLGRLGRGAVTVALAWLPLGLARLLAPAGAAGAAPRTGRMRPPGALADDEAFVAACIGCGLCGEVCPPRAIRFHRREGAAQVYTPYIDARERGCTLCGKCMEVCPTEALTVVAREEVAMGVAQIDRAACYPWVDRGVCGACVSVCPLGERAIGFDFAGFYRPVVRAGCVGCGLCVEVCPHPSVPIRIASRGAPTVATHRV